MTTGSEQATTRPTLREAAEWLVKIHADDVTIPRGSALWEDLQALRAALAASPTGSEQALDRSAG